MAVEMGQVYADADPRMKGRTMQVVGIRYTGTEKEEASLKIVSNSDDVQAMLDDPDGHPGSRNYVPKDRRGQTTTISTKRLEGRDYRLVEAPE